MVAGSLIENNKGTRAPWVSPDWQTQAEAWIAEENNRLGETMLADCINNVNSSGSQQNRTADA